MNIHEFLFNFSEKKDNLIDIDLTLQKFKESLSEFAESFAEEQQVIETVLFSVFEELNLEFITIDMLSTLALIKLNVQVENHSRLKKIILFTIKSSKQFSIVPGKGVKKA